MFFIDLDKFKSLNDSYGHDEGDLLLQQVSERLCHLVRESDTVARLGGDEFVMLIEMATTDQAQMRAIMTTIAEKIRHALSRPFSLKTTQFATSASVGIKLFEVGEHHYETILNAADEAMYRSKKQGGNQYSFA